MTAFWLGHAQVVDADEVGSWPVLADDTLRRSALPYSLQDNPDSVSWIDSVETLNRMVETLTHRLDSNHVVLATLRNRMRELVILKDSLVYLNM